MRKPRPSKLRIKIHHTHQPPAQLIAEISAKLALPAEYAGECDEAVLSRVERAQVSEKPSRVDG